MDRIIFNMATMPSRVKSLKPTIESILPQADEINIYLNDFKTIPEFLINDKINILRSQDYFGDIGDVGKFLKLGFVEGYFFTVDDKFEYPSDYAQYLISKIEKFDRKIITSLHGRNFPDKKITSYYYGHKDFFGCLQEHNKDMFVHELGTGVMAFHTDLAKKYKWNMSMFKFTNMTDILFSIECQNNKIPLLLAAHKSGYLKIILNHNDNNSIHGHANRSDKLHTELTNSIRWNSNEINIKNSDGYETHLPVLEYIFKNHKIENVIEFGCGFNSTLFFLRQNCKVHSIEQQDNEWLKKVKNAIGKNDNWTFEFSNELKPEMKFLSDYISDKMPEQISYAKDCDLCFVDGDVSLRVKNINEMFQRAKIIVAHDFECNVYKWQRIAQPNNYIRFVFEHNELNVKTVMFVKKC